VVSDIPVDNEAPLVSSGISKSACAQSFGGAHRGRVCIAFIGVSVTSGISKSVSAQSFRGAHRGRVFVCAFIGVSVRACCERLCCTV
jgi:hypothetical protein